MRRKKKKMNECPKRSWVENILKKRLETKNWEDRESEGVDESCNERRLAELQLTVELYML